VGLRAGRPCPGAREWVGKLQREVNGKPGITGACSELGLTKTIRVIAALCI